MTVFFLIAFLHSQIDSISDTISTDSVAPYKLTDFRLPESGAMRFSVNLSGDMSGGRASDWGFGYSSPDTLDTLF
ncbi:hypothetical protein GX441_10865 [bacterium]|nr:hypothetical protein [bacterium]